MTNNSPRVLQQLTLSDAIHNSPRMVAQREEKTNKTGLPNQLRSGIESLSTDLRPLSVAQRHLQNIASNSSRAQQLQSIQRMVQRSEPAMQFQTRTRIPDALAVQLVEGQQSVAMGGKSIVKEPIQLKADVTSGTRSNALSIPTYSSPVAQRLMNPAPLVGAATSYHVSAADLGTGTGTTPAVRLWAQANAPGPNPINFQYAISNAAGTAIVGGWNGPFVAPNPAPAGGANWHAGHILARQNGGPGHVGAANWIMPQNPQVNMGHAGTYGLWRAHEVAFHNLVGANGHGIWHVW